MRMDGSHGCGTDLSSQGQASLWLHGSLLREVCKLMRVLQGVAGSHGRQPRLRDRPAHGHAGVHRRLLPRLLSAGRHHAAHGWAARPPALHQSLEVRDSALILIGHIDNATDPGLPMSYEEWHCEDTSDLRQRLSVLSQQALLDSAVVRLTRGTMNFWSMSNVAIVQALRLRS